MQIARRRAKTVSRQPQIDIARLDLAVLSQLASRPIGLDSADDEGFSLNGPWFLMLNRFQVTVAQFCQCQTALRAINLPLLIPKHPEFSLCKGAISCFERPLDFLAVRFDASIINAVR